MANTGTYVGTVLISSCSVLDTRTEEASICYITGPYVVPTCTDRSFYMNSRKFSIQKQ